MAVFKNLPKVCLVLLFAWISFFPTPVPEKYYFYTTPYLLVWFILLFKKKKSTLFRSSDFPLWLYLFAISLSLGVALEFQTAFLTYFGLSTSLFFIYYLMAENFSSEENFLFFAKTVCFFSILIAFWGILDSVLGVNFLYESYFQNPFYERYKLQLPVRALATQFHAPPLGTYLLASLPFSLWMIKQKRLFDRGLGLLGVFLIVPAAILTCSRGVFLGLLTMVLSILFLENKTKRIFFVAVGVVAFVFVFSNLEYPLNKLGVEGLLGPGDSILSLYRFERIQMLGGILRDFPFWGVGFQHVRLLFPYFYPGNGMETYEFMIMDNMYLTLAAETGMLGFTCFMIFLGSMIIKAWNKMAGLGNELSQRTALIYVLAGFFGLLVNAAAYELFYWPNQYMFFCFYVGLIEAFHRRPVFRGPAKGSVQNPLWENHV